MSSEKSSFEIADSMEGLLRMTGIVKSLSITVMKSISTGLVSIVRDIIKGSHSNCKEIAITAYLQPIRHRFITSSDTEAMLQVCNYYDLFPVIQYLLRFSIHVIRK